MDNSCYQSTTLHKGQVHEVLIQNIDKGSVITWDFDVMKHDVMFSVFRTKDTATVKKTPPPTPTTLGSFNLHTNSDQEHYTAIEKGWKEGADYFRVEAPIVCHDGESIQGSHVTSFVGTYLLQWSYFERVSSGTAQDKWDHMTHPQHKAKVMFYYEILNSLDYKGSMTSLQSIQSAFSNISRASHHQDSQSTSGVSSGVSSASASAATTGAS